MPLLLSDRAVPVSPLPLFTPAECRMLGIPLSPRTMHRVRSGVYVDRKAYAKLPPWSKYAVRVHAFALKHPDAILAFESAAVPHGLPRFGETRDIHVFDPERSRSRRFGDVVVHTSTDVREFDHVHGLLATSILDTVVDLGRVLSPARSLAVFDASISGVQGGPLSVDELHERADDQENARGRALLRWLFSHADGAAESPSESVSRAVIEWSGFETPVLQKEFRYEGELDRTDFYFPSTGTIGEADGWQKYKLDDPEEAAQRLADEKRREDRLRRHGHPFARWELTSAWQVTPLVKALLAGRVKRISHPQQSMLASLRHNPRDAQWSRNHNGHQKP
ncbi:hypothetical protein [Microbacterium sp.]|uniref:hypothetical protein n=1 Tax=Microbacterium sp. TaxID=51671 RepID=UPI003F9A2829